MCRSKEPQGGLSRETEEIEVGNSHQKLPNQERCRQEPPCKGTEGSGGKGGECVCVWLSGILVKDRRVMCLR